MDARNAPLPIQLEAYQKGIIPYIPGMDMEALDRLIKTHGYIQAIAVDPDELDEDDDG